MYNLFFHRINAHHLCSLEVSNLQCNLRDGVTARQFHYLHCRRELRVDFDRRQFYVLQENSHKFKSSTF